MRIIAGRFRSRRLKSLPGTDLRPTSDRLRETLFDVVAASLAGSLWIDMFAGTGAVGIEALSRGARQVYFVEAARSAAHLIRENLASLGVAEGFEVIERGAEPALRLLESQVVACDFLFLDPPYRMHQAYARTLGFLSTSRLLSPSSLVIAEHDKHFDPGDRFGSLQRTRTLKQGDAVLSFYRIV
jgi:16S rRNA (guanine966-N2)-methyltransferase